MHIFKFDPLSSSKKLQSSGIAPEHADEIVNCVSSAIESYDLATKKDLNDAIKTVKQELSVKIDNTKNELRDEINSVRSELNLKMETLKCELKDEFNAKTTELKVDFEKLNGEYKTTIKEIVAIIKRKASNLVTLFAGFIITFIIAIVTIFIKLVF